MNGFVILVKLPLISSVKVTVTAKVNPDNHEDMDNHKDHIVQTQQFIMEDPISTACR